MHIDHTAPASYPDLRAMPEDSHAICSDDDAWQCPAVVFNDAATPGALVSWAWSQLTALDTLLRELWTSRAGDDDNEVAAAVHTTLGPVINALRLSEERARELRKRAAAPTEVHPRCQ